MGKTPLPSRQNRRRRASQPSAPEKPALRVRLLASYAKFRSAMSQRLSMVRTALLWLARALALAAMVALFVAAGRLLERHMRTSEAFATRVIDVMGNDRLASEEVLQAAGLSLGKNVFEVSPEEAQRRLVEHPWVASANVARRLPDTYSIEVSERKPVALLALDTLYLISADGGVFKSLEEGDPSDFPVITGVDAESFTHDRGLRTRLLVSVVSMLHDYRDAGLFRREPIAEIHVAPDESFSVYVGKDATHVRLGKAPFRRKLRQFRRVLDRMRKERLRPAYVYLDNVRRPDRVTVFAR